MSSFQSYYELDYWRRLKPGDLIEIDRGSYNHWVMFVEYENNSQWCFHATTGDGDFEKMGAVKSSMSSMGSVSTPYATIKKHKLRDIMKDNGEAEPSRARVNNQEAEANKRQCTPRRIQQVVAELEKQRDQPVAYNLKDLNCEHYVTKWKYGSGWSRQVEEVAINAIQIIGVVAGAFIGAIGRYYGFR